jgi:hypothetical protein
VYGTGSDVQTTGCYCCSCLRAVCLNDYSCCVRELLISSNSVSSRIFMPRCVMLVALSRSFSLPSPVSECLKVTSLLKLCLVAAVIQQGAIMPLLFNIVSTLAYFGTVIFVSYREFFLSSVFMYFYSRSCHIVLSVLRCVTDTPVLGGIFLCNSVPY